MNFYNDNSRKISKLQKMLIIVSFIIIIIWGIYFVIHVINTIENNNPISNSLIYSSLSSFIQSYFIWYLLVILKQY
jgi:uncharacterized protein YneF (UPF0154 family)